MYVQCWLLLDVAFEEHTIAYAFRELSYLSIWIRMMCGMWTFVHLFIGEWVLLNLISCLLLSFYAPHIFIRIYSPQMYLCSEDSFFFLALYFQDKLLIFNENLLKDKLKISNFSLLSLISPGIKLWTYLLEGLSF